MNNQDKKTLTVYFLISLALAFVIWAYVVTVVSPETTETISNIPVTFTGEEVLREQQLAITEGRNAKVTVRVTGKRSDVSGLNADNVIVTVDVSKIRSAGEYTKACNVSLPSGMQGTSTTKNPSEISFFVEELLTREIPVKISVQATTADGYMMGTCKAITSTITVTGVKSQVESLDRAIVIVDDTNLNGSVIKNMDYSLVDTEGNVVELSDFTVDEESVAVSIEVRSVKSVPLYVVFESGGGATEANITCEIKPASVTISGDEAVLAGINKLQIDTVNLSAVTDDSNYSKPIILPDGVTNESGVTNAQIFLTVSGLSKRTMSISGIGFVNVPEGYRAVPGTLTEKSDDTHTAEYSVMVTIRGPESLVEGITVSDITLKADLSAFAAATAGSYTCEEVTVSMEGFPECGILGSVSISFTLMTEKEYKLRFGGEN